MNDLGSGGNIDICVITKDSKVHTRGYRKPALRKYKAVYDAIPVGATPLVSGKDADVFRRKLIVKEGVDEDGDIVM